MTTRDLADEILVAVETAKPHRWSEYNVLSGRMEDKYQPMREAQLDAVVEALAKNGLWPEMRG